MTDKPNQTLYIPVLQGLYVRATPVFEAILRLVAGGFLMPHGAQKLFGLFGGHGIAGTAGFFASIGLEPAVPLAILAGLGEFVGGFCLAIGFMTRPAAIVTSILLGVAICSVHISKGFFLDTGGFEYAALWFFTTLYFVFRGGNQYSVDARIGRAF